MTRIDLIMVAVGLGALALTGVLMLIIRQDGRRG